MLDLGTRIRRHVDAAAPPVDVDAIVRGLVVEATPLSDPTGVIAASSPVTRWSPLAAFAAALVVLVTAIVGVAWLLADDAPVVGDTAPPSTETLRTAPPETTAPPTTTTPSTTVATPATPRPAEPAEPMTLAELQAVFDDAAQWSEELRELYAGSSFTSWQRDVRENFGDDETDFFGLEVGMTIEFEGELLGGGSFATDELAGRPAVIVAWYGEPEALDPDVGWTHLHDNLAALQTVYEAFGDRLGVVSVFIPYDEAFRQGEPAVNPPGEAFYAAVTGQLAGSGYTFPVLVEPTNPGGTPMNTWVQLGDTMPTWILLDASGRIIEGFMGFAAPIPVGFLLAELTG